MLFSLEDVQRAPGWAVLIVLALAAIAGLEAQQVKLSNRVSTLERVNLALGKKACWESTPAQRVWLGLPCKQLLDNVSPESVP